MGSASGAGSYLGLLQVCPNSLETTVENTLTLTLAALRWPRPLQYTEHSGHARFFQLIDFFFFLTQLNSSLFHSGNIPQHLLTFWQRGIVFPRTSQHPVLQLLLRELNSAP